MFLEHIIRFVKKDWSFKNDSAYKKERPSLIKGINHLFLIVFV